MNPKTGVSRRRRNLTDPAGTTVSDQEHQPPFLPYGRQHITDEDVQAVVAILRSERLTQGPAIEAFEDELARLTGAAEAVACASGTAALHLAMLALGLGPGDEIVTSPVTFLASANCAHYVGADVRFADVNADSGLMDPAALARILESDHERRIKAIVPVHLAGQPVDLAEIYSLAHEHGAVVVDDACHALGAEYDYGEKSWRLGGSPYSDMTTFSFHPVKHVAMGEGGAVTTSDTDLARRLRRFRNHGMQKEDFSCPEEALAPDGSTNPWYYEMQQLGYNYRLTDIQAALGKSQLGRLAWSLNRRRRLAEEYCRLLADTFDNDLVRPLTLLPGRQHAYHLFVVLIDFDHYGIPRAVVMKRLREAGIGTQVHYIPIHLQPYYRERYGTGPGDFPHAEQYYARALSLPMYPDLTEVDCLRVIRALEAALMREP
ncbi:MAG: UDP-4-amino-4,6-dideoxy-N-acetyl-beta-L-altrosamine transaminase [bacterium]